MNKSKTFSYQEALGESVKYFDGDELAAKVFLDKYSLKNNEGEILENTPEKMHRRIASEFARIEKKKFKDPLSEDTIFALLDKFKYIVPQGSPMFGIGNNFQTISLSNCFVAESPVDSYGGILKTDQQLVQISKRRGGVGVDLSNLRPNGSVTRNAAKSSTGIVSWMERYSNSIREVGQCIAKGQKVLTKRGIINIEDVIPNKDYVWTKIGWVKVIGLLNNGIKTGFKIQSKSGYEVVTSSDHIYQTFNQNGELTETKLRDLSVNDNVVLCLGNGYQKNYVAFDEFIHKNINYKPNNCILPSVLNEELAYVLGYSYGDGSVEVNQIGEPILLDLACSNDYPAIKSALEKYIKNVFDYQINYRTGDGDLERLSINNKCIIQFLKHNGLLKEKAKDILFPQNIIDSPISVQIAFLCGYFDADGYASGAKKGYCFNSISLNFIHNCQLILSSMGIPTKVHEEDRSKCGWNNLYSLAVVGQQAQSKLVTLFDKSIKIQGLGFVAQRDCWLTPFKAQSFNVKHNNYDFCPDNTQFLSFSVANKLKQEHENVTTSLLQDSIANIEEIGPVETFDLQLEKENLFWCNGFYLHNSGRRGALMLTLSVHHPDIMEFVTIKNDDTKVTGANISVRLTDEFLNAVKKDEQYELRFPVDSKTPKISKMVSAKEIWKAIIHSAWLRAEPGLLFWDNIINYNAVDCYKDAGFASISTNPCSEIPLPAYDSCRLLVLNFFSFVKNPFTENAKFDFTLFYEYAKIAQRLMDDLIDLEIEKINDIITKIQNDPEATGIKAEELNIWKNVRKIAEDGRRTGLGGTGLGDTLAALGIHYGCEESIAFVEKLQKKFKHASYESSMEMSKEVGPFKVWDWEVEKDSAFLLQIKEEYPELYANIAKHGRRNIANLTFAPTGSVSLVTQTTSGCEPLFMLNPYIRRKKINPTDKDARVDFVDPSGDSWQEFKVYHPKVKMWMEVTGETDLKKSPWYGACAEDIDWINRVKLQAAMQRHIDHAISSTINLPENVSEDKVAEIYQSAWEHKCKGITVYRKNCRTGVLVEEKQAPQEDRINKTKAPARLKTLECDVYHPAIKGHRYYVVVGLLKDDPYEVFTGSNHDNEGEVVIPKSVTEGKITKHARGKYVLEYGDKEFVLTNGHSDANADTITRMVSTALRHGADIRFVVEQLEKTEGDLFAFGKVLARTLKKYIPDGSHGEKCECGGEIIRENGCKICKSCGSSACS